MSRGKKLANNALRKLLAQGVTHVQLAWSAKQAIAKRLYVDKATRLSEMRPGS